MTTAQIRTMVWLRCLVGRSGMVLPHRDGEWDALQHRSVRARVRHIESELRDLFLLVDRELGLLELHVAEEGRGLELLHEPGESLDVDGAAEEADLYRVLGNHRLDLLLLFR